MEKLIKRIDNILKLNGYSADIISKREKHLETKFLDYDINYCDYYDCIIYEQEIIKKHNRYIESLYKIKELLMKSNINKKDSNYKFYSLFNDINAIYYKSNLDIAIKEIIERKNKILETIILFPDEQTLPTSINDINEDIVFLRKLNETYNNINKFNQSNLLLDYENGVYVDSKLQPTKREKFIYNQILENSKRQPIAVEPEVVSFITTPYHCVEVKKKKRFSFKKSKY